VVKRTVRISLYWKCALAAAFQSLSALSDTIVTGLVLQKKKKAIKNTVWSFPVTEITRKRI
jgi:hypothetical protein